MSNSVLPVPRSTFCWSGLRPRWIGELLESARGGVSISFLLDGIPIAKANTAMHVIHSVLAGSVGRTDCRTVCPPLHRDVNRHTRRHDALHGNSRRDDAASSPPPTGHGHLDDGAYGCLDAHPGSWLAPLDRDGASHVGAVGRLFWACWYWEPRRRCRGWRRPAPRRWPWACSASCRFAANTTPVERITIMRWRTPNSSHVAVFPGAGSSWSPPT